jgi:exopolysaccharide biosynthesis polyprenyl glycosylphosphotransferase
VTFLFQHVRFGEGGGAVDIGVDVVDYRSFSLIVSIAWVCAIVLATGRTRLSDIGILRFQGIFVATFAVFLGTAVLALLLQSEVSRAFVLTVFPSGIVLLWVGRLGWSAWLRRQRARGAVVTPVVIVGSARAAHRLEREFVDRVHTGMLPVALALHSDAPDGEGGKSTVPVERVLSGADAARLAVAAGAELVVVADAPPNDPNFLQDLAWGLEGAHAGLAVSSQFGLVSASRLSIVPIGGHPLVYVESTHLSASKNSMKRAFDVAVASIALVVSWPVLALIAVAVRLDSEGPAVFVQERIGRDGRPFQMFKFRSMAVGSESVLPALAERNEGAGPLFKMREDPRVTRIGRVLRRSSLDELPQIVNVLRGDMSFVGPRPAIPEEVARYGGDARRRLLLRPGLTGVWQVSGRSNLPWDEGLRLDLTYVENWSLLGDLVVLFRTIGAVITRRGAY